jgi:hypothetical protein
MILDVHKNDLKCLSRIPDPDFVAVPDPGSASLDRAKTREQYSTIARH